jgi:hypothetical protein
MKTKKIKQTEATDETLAFIPPETHYLSSVYTVTLPADDKHFESPWKLRLFAAKLVERKLGDQAQVTDLRVKQPHLIAKSKARLLKRAPSARLLVTIKF